MHRSYTLSLVLTCALATSTSIAAPSAELTEKILSQGVPADAYQRLMQFIEENQGRDFVIDTYACKGKPEDSIKPCIEAERSPSTQTVSVKDPRYVVIVDFTKESSTRRMYLIDLQEGDVLNYYVSHGSGTGNSNSAMRFSNIKDSHQTSLGVYVTGGTYRGKYGETLRLYGLNKSNDAAYNRDIVLHGAWYVSEDFMNSINKQTKEKYGRLGVSWGCPAVSESVAKKIIPLLKDGALVYHYFEGLMDRDEGEQVGMPRPRKRP